MIELDAATVCLQWATGGLAFLWVTTRRREVGVGYGWLLRGTYLLIAALGVVVGLRYDRSTGRELAAAGVVVATGIALVSSVVRRRAGVAGEWERRDAARARVAGMTTGAESLPGPRGFDRTGIERRDDGEGPAPGVPEFRPELDLVAPVIGAIGLVFAAESAGGPLALALARTIVGALFLGAVTDAMLLGHWYLVQPGLARGPLLELVRWTGRLWPLEVAVLLVPTGMLSVLAGTVDDGYGGILGWFWLACAVTTVVLVGVTRAALRERYYSAVMAATGLLYLAILTAFGTDLVARAVLG